MILCPRLHLFEINDQPWWPQYLREKVQDGLTAAWTFRVPLVQSQTPANLVVSTLTHVLGDRVTDYAYVDFASGAGGPTPWIEQELNRRIRQRRPKKSKNEEARNEEDAKFVLTDLHPHTVAWEAASRKSDNLRYIPDSVDAADAPKDLLKRVAGVPEGKKVMRLFSLAFHHFDDDLAKRILGNTIDTSDGFGIFELQSRTISSFITVFLFGPLIGFVLTPVFFWHLPLQLVFTYLIPLIPFCLVYDGYISSLRTRTPDEVKALLQKANGGRELQGWKFLSGEEMHTWPTGWMSWIICVKDKESQSEDQ